MQLNEDAQAMHDDAADAVAQNPAPPAGLQTAAADAIRQAGAPAFAAILETLQPASLNPPAGEVLCIFALLAMLIAVVGDAHRCGYRHREYAQGECGVGQNRTSKSAEKQ